MSTATQAAAFIQGKQATGTRRFDFGSDYVLDLTSDFAVADLEASDIQAIINAYSSGTASAVLDLDSNGSVSEAEARQIANELLTQLASDTNSPASQPPATGTPATGTTAGATSRTVYLPDAASPKASAGEAVDKLVTDTSTRVANQIYTEGYHYEQGMSGMMCGMATTVVDVKGDKLLDRNSNNIIDDLNNDGKEGNDEDIVIANAFVRGIAALNGNSDGYLSSAECRAKDRDSNGIITGADLGLTDFNFQFAYTVDESNPKKALTLTLQSENGSQSYVSLRECTQGTDGQIDLTSMGLAKASQMVNTAYTEYLKKVETFKKLIEAVMAMIKTKKDDEDVQVEETANGIKINGTEVLASKADIASAGITAGTFKAGVLKTTLSKAQPAPAAAVIAEPVKTDTKPDSKADLKTSETNTNTSKLENKVDPKAQQMQVGAITGAIGMNT